MIIKENKSHSLVIDHNNRGKEWTIAFFIGCIGFLPFLHTTDEFFLKMMKFVFLGTFFLVGLLYIHDEFVITFSQKKRKIIIQYRNIIEVISRKPGNEIVLDLDLVQKAIVKEVPEPNGKKTKLFKLIILYNNGLDIGVTDSYFFTPEPIEPIRVTINQWLKENGINGADQVSSKQEKILTPNNHNFYVNNSNTTTTKRK
ncbi:hypothetical protein DLAC_02035 [Tieghemostelium lacteum]|uniref:Essential for reactive oxygen species protein n=1 Tax=Tieghemostelium lacteum TaxID=361077 RepID=A0A152A4Z6_TIELA|nr:hypothetical protein DLAC_02035 [Tieghemostelium lacteum]|eukprot:KYR01313.1 hypothetical protein DLAC_02035 [Tieghemostelium lacteum]